MNKALVSLVWISLQRGMVPALIDGAQCVLVSEEDYLLWCRETGLNTPIFAEEVDASMLEKWEFAWNLGEVVDFSQERFSNMSTPHNNGRFGPGSCNAGNWKCSSTSCDIKCDKCGVLYPIFGRFTTHGGTHCGACGYFDFVVYL